MSTEGNGQLHGDPLSLCGSDHPGSMLTNKQFNGDNYVEWSNSTHMALGAQLKLGFVNGSCAKPDANSANFQRWITCEYMVRCWLLNSFVSNIVECLYMLNLLKSYGMN